MPQQPGEVSLLTLFADVHFFFSHPAARPPHDRFDKGSYVYLYHNATDRRARIEIANHAGTPEQDAFMGYLDMVQVNRTYKQPNLFTITVDPTGNGSAPGTPQQDFSQWHLPAPDPRNEGKYMYKLHTLDLYFWTVDDSNSFADSIRKTLQPHQVRILEAQQRHSEHSDTMSPVVQKLEQIAVSKPYQHRSNSVSTTQSYGGPVTGSTLSKPSEGPQGDAASYAPMAYNPAAPAAPEPIAHREKTPPPVDAESGTGLAAAAMHDQSNQFPSQPLQQQATYQQHQPYMPGPPRQSTQSFPPPPLLGGSPHPHMQRATTTNSFPPPPQAAGTPPYGQTFAPPPTQAATPPYGQTPMPPHPGVQRTSTMPAAYSSYPSQQPQYATYPQSPGYPPVQSPGHSATPGHVPTPVQSPGFPPGSYSSYSYTNNQQSQDPYAIHGQAYRPTETEAAHGGKKSSPGPGPGAPGPGKFEQRVDRVEKGVSKFLKRLDKKL
ncbi:uncharacterized protein K452DRAFT_251868 [Aplosporella prunicola CBS 121167]|uniref:RNA recognition motif-containing protein n=1 Tax=Aplosporella prunicola CBS 121167 TaxID=1176127 RepID=A0A6A6BCC5_9PEZI|nr:uncharacterized protein K452DRAFT_251868 [Aplosporella prunicola CBS 121167]KAF2141003.1 hypothetical protein K452DRAFT_251868 [Aplosporella prunicola CBS 121167]